MSETIAMPPLGTVEKCQVPTVYFIDDSATMREVIKIAFRRENIHVITCADASSALAQFEEHRPDIVITDVIMPDQDGYSVCSQIKQNPQYAKIPVILMSGVVNKNVADRAVAVQADELVRKPFQPQELIGRVKNLLGSSNPPSPVREDHPPAVPSLSSLFATQPAIPPGSPRLVPPPVQLSNSASANEPPQSEAVWPRALAEAFLQQNPGSVPQSPQPVAAAPVARPPAAHVEPHKLRAEIARLDLLVKKLQTELQIERQYNQALELHVRSLIQID
jgi:twitching motility two-component system response regulator PilH